MNFHEYQSKKLFAQYTVRTACGSVADSAEGAVSAAEGLGERF
jgi:succinyl-CoA synthetase beta subunit